VEEYIAKLRKLADGALAAIDRRIPAAELFPGERQRWEGYRQALDDVEHEQTT